MAARQDLTPAAAASSEPPARGRELARWGLPVAIVAGYLPLVGLHLRRLWAHDHYRYFPFVLLAVAYLTWTRCGTPQASAFGRTRELFNAATRIGPRCLAVALAVLAGAVLLGSPWLAAVSAIVLAGGLLRQVAPRNPADGLVGAWLLLWLLIPLPFRWDERLIYELQGISSRAGSQLLDALGYNHVLTGHVLQIPGHRFLVEDACSGIRSLFTLIALAAIVAVWWRRGGLHGLLLVAAAGVWAVLMNVLRVAGVVALQVWFGWDVSAGLPHDALGLALFGLSLGLLLSTDQLLRFLLAPVPREEDELDEEPRSTAEPPPAARASLLSPAASLAFGLCFATLAIGQAAIWAAVATHRLDATDDDHWVAAFGEDTLPAHLGDWSRAAFAHECREEGNELGRHSLTWTYRGNGNHALISFDFPFVGWHRLTDCYRAQGWEVLSQEVLADEPSQEKPAVLCARLRDGRGELSWLLVSQFDGRGQPLSPPGASGLSLSSWQRAACDRLARRRHDLGLEADTYQLQMHVTPQSAPAAAEPLPPECLAGFHAARKAILEHWASCR